MMRTRRIALLAAAAVSVATVDACHHAPPPEPTPVQTTSRPAPGPNADSARLAQAAAARRDADDASRRRAADSANNAASTARNAANATGMLRTTLTNMVHFDFDQSELRAEDKAILDAKIPILQANPGVSIRISGHTDERGSDEYNLALGQRRAAAVKDYLTQHGVQATRIETTSYGEERPIAQGSDENAWSQNRRAEFEITAGGQNLRQP